MSDSLFFPGTRAERISKVIRQCMPTQTIFFAEVEASQPVWKKWWSFVCGIPESRTHVVEPVADRIRRLRETSGIKAFLDINAVMGVCVVAFLLGFYH